MIYLEPDGPKEFTKVEKDNPKTGYLHTLKDPQFQTDLQAKLKNISEKRPLDYRQRKECYSIESPSGMSDNEFKEVENNPLYYIIIPYHLC